MKVIIDFPLHSLVLDANPALLNTLIQATIVSKDYTEGTRYRIENSEKLHMTFIKDNEFERTSFTPQIPTKKSNPDE